MKESKLKHISNQELMDELKNREDQGIILISHKKKEDEVNYWKIKAYILFQYSNIARLECPKHDTHIERTFDIWKAIKERECLTCKAQAEEAIKKYAQGIKCDLNEK